MIYEIDYHGLCVEFYFDPATSETMSSASWGGDPSIAASADIAGAWLIDPDEWEKEHGDFIPESFMRWCEDSEEVQRACVDSAEEERGAA